LLRLRPTLPVSWHPEEVKVTKDAAAVLEGTISTLGPCTDGSGVVAVTG
ncbi:hypothetical protein KIPB_016028, partial [Kipferlia bialata]